MFEADALEFPFVASLPKREKSRVSKLWDQLRTLRDVTERNGAVVPLTFAAKLLNVSRQRCDELMREGRLERVTLDGHVFLTERSIVALANSERKNGRPFKVASSSREVWKMAVETVEEDSRK